jgi:hypothetical protein
LTSRVGPYNDTTPVISRGRVGRKQPTRYPLHRPARWVAAYALHAALPRSTRLSRRSLRFPSSGTGKRTNGTKRSDGNPPLGPRRFARSHLEPGTAQGDGPGDAPPGAFTRPASGSAPVPPSVPCDVPLTHRSRDSLRTTVQVARRSSSDANAERSPRSSCSPQLASLPTSHTWANVRSGVAAAAPCPGPCTASLPPGAWGTTVGGGYLLDGALADETCERDPRVLLDRHRGMLARCAEAVAVDGPLAVEDGTRVLAAFPCLGGQGQEPDMVRFELVIVNDPTAITTYSRR